MKTYHKIQTVFKRDPDNKFKTLLEGEFSMLEFEYLKNNIWVFTEKVDGTNIRIMFQDGKITFGGKTDKAQMPTELANRLNDIFLSLKSKFIDIFGEADVCLYGEGYGARIQKGGELYRQDNGFVLFDIKIGNWWLKREDVEDIANKLGLEIIPIIGEGTIADLVNKVKAGFNSQWGDFPAEGIVARPKVELISRNGGRIITKLKYKDYNNGKSEIDL